MVLLCKIISKSSPLKSSWSGNGIYKHRKVRNHLVYKFVSWSFFWIFLKTWLLYSPAFEWIISVNELDFYHRGGNQSEVSKCCRKNLNPGFSVFIQLSGFASTRKNCFIGICLPPQWCFSCLSHFYQILLYITDDFKMTRKSWENVKFIILVFSKRESYMIYILESS